MKLGINLPELETENEQKSSTKKNDNRHITPHSVNLQVVYRESSTFTCF